MMKKLYYSVLTFLSVVCLAIGVMLMTGVGYGANKANATTVDGQTPTFSTTRYMVSSDGESILFVTAIGNCADVYSVGYSIVRDPSLTTVNAPAHKYYTSLTVGGNTWTTADLFGAGYTGMIVGEYTGYDVDAAVRVNIYAHVGDREDEVLVESATTEWGTAIEPVAVVDGSGTYNTNQGSGYNFYLGTSVENWQSSDALLVFDYKPDSATNKTYVGLGNANGWYSTSKLNFNNNTVTNMASNVYTITDLGGGWYRAKILINSMGVLGGSGTETLNRVVFYWVNTGFTVKNVKIVEESLVYSIGKDYVIPLPDYDASSPAWLSFDLKIESSGSDKFWVRIAQDGSNYYGQYKFTRSGIATNDATAGAIQVTSNDGDGLLHIVIALHELTTKNGSPTKVVQMNDVASWTSGAVGYVTNVKISNVDPSYEIVYEIGANYVIPLPDYDASSPAWLSFDLKIESSGENKFWVRIAQDGSNYFGGYKFTRSGIATDDATVGAIQVTSNDGDGLLHIVIALHELTTKTGSPTKVTKITDHGNWTSGAEGYVTHVAITDSDPLA